MTTRVDQLRSEINAVKATIRATLRAKHSETVLATLYERLDNLQLDLEDEVYYATAA